MKDFKSLNEFNKAFQDWLNLYHQTVHSSILNTPKDSYFNSQANIKVRNVPRDQLDEAFLVTHNRLVHKDATVRLRKHIFEVPARFIGQKIDLHHPIDQPSQIHILDLDGTKISVKRADMIGNSETPALGIRYRCLPEVAPSESTSPLASAAKSSSSENPSSAQNNSQEELS